MKKLSLSLAVSTTLLITGCSTISPNIGKIGGTTAGTAAGAAIGKQLGGNKGMFIGALVGGAMGYFIGDNIDKRRAELAKIAKKEKLEVYTFDVRKNDLAGKGTLKDNVTNNSSKVVGDIFTVVSKDSQFAIGSSKLSHNATIYFGKFAQQYKSTKKKLLIIGHTDDSGSSSSNQRLSEKRAKSVGQIFAQNGVAEQNIYYLGAGETLPVADNNTPEGASKNRRVEIVELQDEKDIAQFVSSRTPNQKFFRPVIPTYVAKKSTQKKEKKSTSSKVKSSINKQFASAKKAQKVSKSIHYGNVKKIADFSGNKVLNNSFGMKRNFGAPVGSNSSFSLITEAQASDSMQGVYLNCMYDKPRIKGETKSLATGKDMKHKTTEYKKGLNESSWVANVDNNLVAIAPVGVLRDGDKVSKLPKILLYKNYVAGSNPKADFKATTQVNTYQGTKGMLYRVFINKSRSQLRCMDIVFDKNSVNDSNAQLYYVQNNAIYKKTFRIKQIQKK